MDMGNSETGIIEFSCNICGHLNFVAATAFHRELALCVRCKSNARFRGIIHVLTIGLFGRSMSLAEINAPNICGIGMSDAGQYAEPLKERMSYVNTFYHCDPRLDIMDTQSTKSWIGQDFVISTDVFEHVPPPVQIAFTNTFTILKPGGLFVFSAPYTEDDETTEHFQDLYNYEVVKFRGTHVLVNRRADGRLWIRDDLVFHGGPGSTLEMRLFGRAAIMTHLKRAGFHDLMEFSKAVFEIGYCWPANVERSGFGRSLSYIISARKPDSSA